MPLVSMKDLLLFALKDLHSAETQLARTLPAMIKGSGAPSLRRALNHHLRRTEEHVDRLQVICEALETFPGGQRCRGMEGMIEEVRTVLRSIGTQSVVDAAIIAVAQRISHYEIAAYAAAGNYATMLGLDDISDLLAMSLQEEEAVETELTDIANEEVNDRALVGMTESEHLSPPQENFLDPAGRLPHRRESAPKPVPVSLPPRTGEMSRNGVTVATSGPGTC